MSPKEGIKLKPENRKKIEIKRLPPSGRKGEK